MKKKKSLVDLEYLKDLSEFLKDSDISELEIEKEGIRVRIKKSSPRLHTVPEESMKHYQLLSRPYL